MTKPVGYPDTPNLDKQHEVQDKALLLSEFVDWLNNIRGYHICQWFGEALDYASYGGYNRLFADFFEIDYEGIERERQALLEWMRSQDK